MTDDITVPEDKVGEPEVVEDDFEGLPDDPDAERDTDAADEED